MSKSTFSQAVRAEYKNEVREIKIKADIVLSERDSTNLSPNFNKEFKYGYDNKTWLKIDGTHYKLQADNTVQSYSQSFELYGNGIDYDTWILPAGTYTFGIIIDSQTGASFDFGFHFWYGNNYDVVITNNSLTQTITFSEDTNIYDITGFGQAHGPGTTNYKLMINQGTSLASYEESGIIKDIFTIGEGTSEIHESPNLLPQLTKHIDNINGESTNVLSFDYENGKIKFNGKLDGNSKGVSLFDDFEDFSLPAGTYTFSIQNKKRGSTCIFQFGMSPYFTTSNISSENSGIVYQTKTFQNVAKIVNNYIEVNRNWTLGNVDDEFNIMLNEGDTVLPFEESGAVTVISPPQILNINVDETSDIYYEKMPFSEMCVEVDNIDGYFSDFTEKSITNQLNKNCYVDIYLDVNNTGWCKSWTMQFDRLSADNESAKLYFKPYVSSIIGLEQLYDKNKQFLDNTGMWDLEKFNSYMKTNYNVEIEEDETNSGRIMVNWAGSKNIDSMLLQFASAVGNNEKGQILSIKENKILRYKRFVVYGTTIDNITSDIIIQKPVITKETLQGIVNKFISIESYTSSPVNWQKQVDGVLKENTDVLVVYENDHDLSNVSTSDITITGASLVSVSHSISGGAMGLGSHYLLLEISGNAGERYTININASVPHTDETSSHEEIYAKGSYETTKDFIKLQLDEVINTYYWEQLINHLQKKITFQVKALPYLQVGDSITLENEGNVVITELHTKWNNGFLMDVVAYKVEYFLGNN